MESKTNTLVIYVHGALSSKRSWKYINSHINKKANTAVEFYEYNLQKVDAHVIQSELTCVILENIVKYKPKKLLIIGHSFGGVLAVGAAHDISMLATEVELQVITLASPFAGSRVNHAMFTLSFLFNMGLSIFLKNISSNDFYILSIKSKPLACHTYAFITISGGNDLIPEPNDGVVSIQSQHHFKNDPLMTAEEVDANHFEILMNDLVVEKINNEIRSAKSVKIAA